MLSISYDSRPCLHPTPRTSLVRAVFVSQRRFTSLYHSSRNHKLAICCSSEILPSSTIQRIADKLRSLGVANDTAKRTADFRNGDAGEIFIPLPDQLPRYRVGYTLDSSWSTPHKPEGQSRPREYGEEINRKRKDPLDVPTLAELTLSDHELRRVRQSGIGERRMLKIGKAGITEGVVNGIHERWRNFEVVKIDCEDLCKMNMKRTHDLLERKTGGLVVWRSGSRIVLYRGPSYKYPYFNTNKTEGSEISTDNCGTTFDHEVEEKGKDSISAASCDRSSSLRVQASQPNLVHGVGSEYKVRFQLPGEAELVVKTDRLLDELGPRFSDWWGYEPLPVDGDLLPAVVPGYRKPFRLLPYGINDVLRNDEVTALRRLGGHLPFHFALGRNNKLQGLAVSILKLWDECEVVKIALKRGVTSGDSKMMADELKSLTGGTLLTRNEQGIMLYRGKDFLPSTVSAALEERRNHGMERMKSENDDRLGDTAVDIEKLSGVSRVGENLETKDHFYHSSEMNMKLCTNESVRTDVQLPMAEDGNKKLLGDLECPKLTKETNVEEKITDEEKFMLRKIGLKMKPFLLMGRRGVFAGTVENMHLHWKYRELVKLICKERSLQAVRKVAHTLEAESGGILVGVESVSKGYAIIVYRGKNYRRPDSLRPPTLPNRKESLNQFVDVQRRKSLKLRSLKYERDYDGLKWQSSKEKRNTSEFDLATIETSEVEQSSVNEAHPSISFEENIKATDDKIQFTVSHDRDLVKGDIHDELHSRNSNESNCILEVKTSTLSKSVKVSCSENNKFSRVKSLSNRERLLLRKQALKMKYRPVLAVGKRNAVTGVAKTIKSHFEKYPLAIVNIKNRAEGTNVKDLIKMLEQETGGIFVSQEPNKVILYRGWGASEPPCLTTGKDQNVAKQSFLNQSPSQNLVEAIRFECGL